MLNEIIRKSMEKGINSNIESYQGWAINHKIGKQMWRYENEVDFWYGHMVGSLIALSYTAFKNVMNRLPNSEEQQEIEELVQVHGTKIRKIVEDWQ